MDDLPLPSQFESFDEPTKALVRAYLGQLNALQRKAYCIGLSHLGTSFNILRSNGYQDWLKKEKEKEKENEKVA